MSENRLEARFRDLRREGRAAFIPFVTAGDPDMPTTAEIVLELERRGADVIELGVPYSDPIADGPTIQASYTRALGAGADLGALFDTVRRIREQSQVPLLTMVSYSIVHKVGQEQYLRSAAEAGIDGVIVPDLPPEEADELIKWAADVGLCTVLLVAPTTPPERARVIAQKATGFIYYISVTGTTGARDSLPAAVEQHISTIRGFTDKPIAVGFGISTPDQARAVARVADGVIVGSAIVRLIAERASSGRDSILSAVGDFVAGLSEAVKGVSKNTPQ